MPRPSKPIMPPRDPKECPSWLYEILRTLGEGTSKASAGIASIARGETPDGSGSPLTDLSQYFYLPGRNGGQVGYGGTAATDDLTLSSTKNSSKGNIFFGTLSTYDEANVRFGINSLTPSAKLVVALDSSTTTTKYAPISNSVVSGWSNTSGDAAGSLYLDINEEPASDTDNMSRVGMGTAPVCTIATIPTPATGTTVVVKWRMQWEGTNGGTLGWSYILSVLDSGSTARSVGATTLWVASGAHGNVVYADYTHTISAAEIATFPSWTGIQIRLQQTGGGVGEVTSALRISYLSVQTTTANSENIVQLSSDSTVVLRIDSSGNIGMGNAAPTPTAMLHLVPRSITTIPFLIAAISTQTANLLNITSAVSGSATFAVDNKAFLQASLKSNSFLVDSTDLTKKLAFDLSGLTTATTRTLTVPDVSGTLITLENPAIITGAWSFQGAGTVASPEILVISSSPGFTGTGLIIWDGNFRCELQGPSGAGFTADRVIQFPDASGTLLTSGVSSQIVANTSSTFTANTSAIGASFTDLTTSTKKLRFVLSGAVGNSSITLTNTAARNYGLGNYSGDLPIIGVQTAAATSGNLGKRDLTAQAAAIGATAITSTALTGMYRIAYYLETTTLDVTAGTIQFQIDFVDDVGATNRTGAALILTATGRDSGSFDIYVASGNITYQTNLVGIIGASRYALRLRATYLG